MMLTAFTLTGISNLASPTQMQCVNIHARVLSFKKIVKTHRTISHTIKTKTIECYATRALKFMNGNITDSSYDTSVRGLDRQHWASSKFAPCNNVTRVGAHAPLILSMIYVSKRTCSQKSSKSDHHPTVEMNTIGACQYFHLSWPICPVLGNEKDMHKQCTERNTNKI